MESMNKVGLVCCSNGQKLEYKGDIDKLVGVLEDNGHEVIVGEYIYERDGISSGKPEERACQLMGYFSDENVAEIFDISGGDIANEILPYLDYDKIRESNVRLWGYSDLTTVINALYSMTGKESVLYQVKNLVWDNSGLQIRRFFDNDIYEFDYCFCQGKAMNGVVVGGNIRCLLKLAGTKYFPDMNEKILFLEALSGGEPQLRTYFAQLYAMGVLEAVNGILLGTFTEYQKENDVDALMDIVKDYVDVRMPIVKTEEIGHGKLSKALIIGKEYSFG